MNLLKAILQAIGTIFKWLWMIFIGFIDIWDLDKLAVAGLIFGLLLAFISGIGIYLSKKEKRKCWTIITTAVELSSILISIISACNLKKR